MSKRYQSALERLNRVARDFLGEASPEALLQRITSEAKVLTGADFSALIILRDGSSTEIAHFTYDAPRELFPDRLPRCVGLLAIPIETRAPARLDDMRGHPAGVGIPVRHPPIAALLAVPLLAGEAVLGELAVANEPGRPAFDEVDEAVLSELAAHAAVAIRLSTAGAAREDAAENRRDLVSMALHNLRTPLAVIRGSLDVLRERADVITPEQRTQLLASAMRGVERIDVMAEEGLLGRPAEAVEPELSDVDPRELLAGLIRDLADVAARKGVSIEVANEVDEPVRLDAALARDALENLLTNAIKHAPSGTAVAVTCRREGGSVRFDVTDRGPGIDPMDQPKVLAGSYRGSSAGPQGAGVGLSIVRRLVEAAGGALGLASQLGHGATFWVTLPVE